METPESDKDMNQTLDRIAAVEAIALRIPRPLAPHMGRMPAVNERGYIVDPDNGTIYPADDRSVLLKVTCESGLVGWGETYGIVAAGVIGQLVDDVIAPLLRGRDPSDVQRIWEDLYNLMRVRGYTSGFWLDALAGVDIALWDLYGKLLKVPVYKLLGGQRRARIPAYITSIPGSDVQQRLEHVAAMHAQGYRAFKVHAAGSFDCVELIRAMRARHPDIDIMLDLHWCHTSAEALAILKRVEDCRLGFVEAPCRYEDIDGLARVGAASVVPLAGGEEWRTVFDARLRLQSGGLTIVQPEMGRTGITQFMRIVQLAEACHARVMPHATIGLGVFMAASLHASCTVENLSGHEFQNNFFGRYLDLFDTGMHCDEGGYGLPAGWGLGITPRDSLWQYRVA